MSTLAEPQVVSTPSLPVASAPVAPVKAKPKAPSPFGVFKTRVNLISTLLLGDRPVIFMRLKHVSSKEEWTHAVRLNHPQSVQIGLNEYRGAFPKELANLADAEILKYLIYKHKTLIGKDVEIEITPQLDKATGKQMFDKNTRRPYFNIRLHSNLQSLPEEALGSLIDKMLAATQEKADTAAADAVKNLFGKKSK